MDSANRQQSTALTQIVAQHTNSEFLQLVRRLLRTMPGDYQLSFKVDPSLAFPIREVVDCQLDPERKHITILTQFMGLIGQAGIMPLHYTEYLLERLQARDPTLLAFLDIFHHQLLQLFYEVNSFSHFYQAMEREAAHPIGDLLAALSGHTDYLPPDLKKYFSGILQLPTWNASGLEQLLTTYFGLPVSVLAQQPKLIRLTQNERTYLKRANQNRQLGRSTLLGKQLWEVQSRFAVRLGPIDYSTFLVILSDGQYLKTLHQLIGDYTQHELEHEIQFLINPETLPLCRISRDQQSKLAWNTRLTSKNKSLELMCIKLSASRIFLN